MDVPAQYNVRDVEGKIRARGWSRKRKGQQITRGIICKEGRADKEKKRKAQCAKKEKKKNFTFPF